MSLCRRHLRAEQPAHDLEIEAINAEAFGPGRFVPRRLQDPVEGGPKCARNFPSWRCMKAKSSLPSG